MEMDIVSELERRAFSKVAWRLTPILTISYFLNYLDRNNVGFAALTMNRQIGLTATQFGAGAGILFLGYCFFEIPSNVALYRFGARVWISRIMITWGLISAATIFVTGVKELVLGCGSFWELPKRAFFRASLSTSPPGFPPNIAREYWPGFWSPFPLPLSSEDPSPGLLLGYERHCRYLPDGNGFLFWKDSQPFCWESPCCGFCRIARKKPPGSPKKNGKSSASASPPNAARKGNASGCGPH